MSCDLGLPTTPMHLMDVSIFETLSDLDRGSKHQTYVAMSSVNVVQPLEDGGASHNVSILDVSAFLTLENVGGLAGNSAGASVGPVGGSASGTIAVDDLEPTAITVGGSAAVHASGEACVILPIVEASVRGGGETVDLDGETVVEMIPDTQFGDGSSTYRMNGSVTYGELDEEPDTLPGFIPSRSRSRSPPLVPFLCSRFCSLGEAFYAAVVGRSRSDEIAVCNFMTTDISIDEVLSICRRRVISEIRCGFSFYFGITENPRRRFDEHSFGGTWGRMIVLVQASSSRTTGYLERSLIAEFRDNMYCMNVGRGGERASEGSPHLLYMVLSHARLLRRRKMIYPHRPQCFCRRIRGGCGAECRLMGRMCRWMGRMLLCRRRTCGGPVRLGRCCHATAEKLAFLYSARPGLMDPWTLTAMTLGPWDLGTLARLLAVNLGPKGRPTSLRFFKWFFAWQ